MQSAYEYNRVSVRQPNNKVIPGQQWAVLKATPRLWSVRQHCPCAVCKYGGHPTTKCFLKGVLVT